MAEQRPPSADEIARYRISPEAFSTVGANSLGNPTVVAQLLGDFCAQVEQHLQAVADGRSSADTAEEAVDGEVRRLGAIFAGETAGYEIVKGYHDVTLPAKLQADLAPHWRRVREKLDGKPVYGLFDWLAALLAEHWRTAKGDDMLLGVLIGPSIRYAQGVLLGIEPRAQS